MSLRALLRMLLNDERLIQKLADSYPIRRAAQLTASFMQRGHEKLEEIKESETLNKLRDDGLKAEGKLSELKKLWEEEKRKIDEQRQRDKER